MQAGRCRRATLRLPAKRRRPAKRKYRTAVRRLQRFRQGFLRVSHGAWQQSDGGARQPRRERQKHRYPKYVFLACYSSYFIQGTRDGVEKTLYRMYYEKRVLHMSGIMPRTNALTYSAIVKAGWDTLLVSRSPWRSRRRLRVQPRSSP